jgi:hypothetical protein
MEKTIKGKKNNYTLFIKEYPDLEIEIAKVIEAYFHQISQDQWFNTCQ